jgi:hypothetical protein
MFYIRRYKEWIIYAFAFSLIVTLVPVVTVLYAQGGEKVVLGSYATNIKNIETFTDGLVVLAGITSVDPASQSFKFVAMLKPVGALAKNPTEDYFDFQTKSSLVPSIAINVFIDGKRFQFTPATPLTTIDMTVFFSDGNVAGYPFDACMSLLILFKQN